MAGKGAVSTGKGNTGYYSGGGTGGKKAGTPKQAPKSTIENTAVGTTAKKASNKCRYSQRMLLNLVLEVTQKRDQTEIKENYKCQVMLKNSLI